MPNASMGKPWPKNWYVAAKRAAINKSIGAGMCVKWKRDEPLFGKAMAGTVRSLSGRMAKSWS